MDTLNLIILSCLVLAVQGWSVPFYPVHQSYGIQRLPILPRRFVRHVRHVHAPVPAPIRIAVREPEEQWQRPKRDHDYDDHEKHHDYDKHDKGVTGPVHTFVKTDKNANYKWGVRHHVGNKYAS